MRYHEPWILGFESSRPEGELSYGPTEIYPERDVYRHPDRQGQVKMQFTKLHDIYALGVILLEIGKRKISLPSVYPTKGRLLTTLQHA